MNPPPIWVQKYGGSSVATPDLLRGAAARIARVRGRGFRLVVVVSAMGDTTDHLLELARSISAQPARRELDVLLSAGEIQSMALLVMALHEIGVPAISFTGQHVGIYTDHRHSDARIQRIDGARIRDQLARDRVVVVAGFQGVNESADITTLGRGGSDTSAVAIAAALGAVECEVLTDVAAVFTSDPRVVPNARRIDHISYDEMLEMANHGARVMHGRAVDLARRYRVPLTVGSATVEAPGTRIMPNEEGPTMEAVVVRAVTQDAAVMKVSVLQVPDRPGVAAKLFTVLGEQGVNIRLIVQAQSHRGHNDITFIVPSEMALPREVLARAVEAVGGASYLVDDQVGLLSVIGEGINREPGVAGRIFSILADEGINIDVITTSNLYITCVVPKAKLDQGNRALHAGLITVG